MKQCARCGEIKDEEEFNWRWKALGRRQSVCRDCQRLQGQEHYERHTEAVRAKASVTKKKAREAAERFVYEYLSYQTCADCGEYDFAVLTYDHVRGKKKMDISSMAAQGYSIEAIQEEMTKCQVVCFNCHMRRENERRSGGRFRRFWPKFPWEK